MDWLVACGRELVDLRENPIESFEPKAIEWHGRSGWPRRCGGGGRRARFVGWLAVRYDWGRKSRY